MLQQKLHFRVETPLFCSGFDPRFSELRAASVKGILRYWYRAIQPDLSKEKEVFGSTKQQSALRLHIDADQLRVSRSLYGFPRYFTFFLKNQRREYIKPGETFTIELLLLPGKENVWRDILTSLWLMTTIGGLGIRCRRGFGTLSLQITDHMLTDSLFRKGNSIKAWKKHVQEGLQQCWRWYPPNRRITHPTVHPTLRMFVYATPCSRWERALTIGANVLQQFRTRYRRKKTVLKMVGIADEKHRYPSATWLRIIRVGEQYYPVYFLLPNDLPVANYQEFIDLWGGWLADHQFEMSEIIR